MTSTTLKLGGFAAVALAGLTALLLLSAGSTAAPEPPAALERSIAPTLEVPAAPTTAAVPTQQRTFVSGTGNDANPCTRTAPCRNFQRAIDETLTGGEVIVLDSAGYGPVTITRGMQLISPAGVYAGITAFSGSAITVNTPAGERVVLRGLTLNGLGGQYGVYVNGVGRLYAQQLVIKNFTGAGVYVRTTTADARFVVEDSVLHDNYMGVWCELAAGVPRGTVDGARLENNDFGVASFDNCRTTVRNSVATGNNVAGFNASFGGTLNIEHSEATHNNIGLYSTSTMRVSETLVADNTTGLAGDITSFGNNSVGGNTNDGSFTGTIPES